MSIRKITLFHTLVLTYHESQWLFLANTLPTREDVFDPCTLFDVLSARAFPRHERTDFAREISLHEDIIRNVREELTALHVWRIETNTLRRGAVVPAVHVFVVHPNG